jgi:Tfp pilus assembly protein FimT
MTHRSRSFARGQALAEYLVALLVLAMLIGFGLGGEDSAVDTLLAAVRTAFDRHSGFISLPL